MIELPGIVPALAQALATRGYTDLTPVQEAVLDPGVGEHEAQLLMRGLTVAPRDASNHLDPAVMVVGTTMFSSTGLSLSWLCRTARSNRAALQRAFHDHHTTPERYQSDPHR